MQRPPKQSIRAYLKKHWYETSMFTVTMALGLTAAYMLTPFMLAPLFIVVRSFTDTMEYRMRKEREDARDQLIAQRRAEFRAKFGLPEPAGQKTAPKPALDSAGGGVDNADRPVLKNIFPAQASAQSEGKPDSLAGTETQTQAVSLRPAVKLR